MSSVSFLKFKESMASARYRGAIPEAELRKLGIPEGDDILICSKHGWDWSITDRFGKIVFDMSDDHFHSAHSAHYRLACEKADAITCPTPTMAKIILAETGRVATVIPDPYEQRETKAHIHDSLLWYGHYTNAPDLERELPSLAGMKIEIVSTIKGFTMWSPKAMDEAFSKAGLVIIPTGLSMAKSGNRAVEAIRRGLFVVANPLPAYSDLGIWLGDIRAGVDWALSHRGEAIRRIKQSQDYVRYQYSPQRIGKLWANLLSSI